MIRAAATLLLVAGCLSGAAPLNAHPGSAEAIAYLSARIDAQAPDQELLRQRGVMYMHDEKFELARADLDHAATLGDARAIAFDLGVLQLRMKDPHGARTSFDTYLDYLPGHPEALRYRAGLRGEQREYDGALRDYAALFTAPQAVRPTDYLAAARLMRASPRHGIDDAIALLDHGMERLGAIPQLQRQAIDLEFELAHYDKAIARLNTLARRPQANPFWHLEMGELLHAAGRTGQAYRHLEHAEQQLTELRKTPARLQLAHDLEARRLLWRED